LPRRSRRRIIEHLSDRLRGPDLMRFPILLAAGLSGGCAVPVTLDFPVGPLTYEVSTDDLMIPGSFAGADGRMVSVPCSGGTCPLQDVSSPLVMTCTNDACDPEPYPFSLDPPPVDLGSYGDLKSLGDHVTAAEIKRLQYQVSTNTMNVELPAVTLYWGPETAASRADPSVMPLGVIPALEAGTTPTGSVDLDPEGQRALADYFVHTSTVFRIFAETSVDLAPGMLLPQGAVQDVATIDVHLEGEGGL
jgi:hypothetical protein